MRIGTSASVQHQERMGEDWRHLDHPKGKSTLHILPRIKTADKTKHYTRAAESSSPGCAEVQIIVSPGNYHSFALYPTNQYHSL